MNGSIVEGGITIMRTKRNLIVVGIALLLVGVFVFMEMNQISMKDINGKASFVGLVKSVQGDKAYVQVENTEKDDSVDFLGVYKVPIIDLISDTDERPTIVGNYYSVTYDAADVSKDNEPEIKKVYLYANHGSIQRIQSKELVIGELLDVREDTLQFRVDSSTVSDFTPGRSIVVSRKVNNENPNGPYFPDRNLVQPDRVGELYEIYFEGANVSREGDGAVDLKAVDVYLHSPSIASMEREL